MQPAIRIADVRKSFGALHALNGVSFDIQQGEFFGLLGPNGAGKSTLINIIAGLIQPSSGSISVMGHDVISHWRAARQSLGVVPQELVFDPFFNVRDMLRLQAGYFGCGKESWPWIDEMLEALELSSKRSTSMRALSGGMKRRVLIAQALVHKPKVVILDEPTAGVDVELRRTLWGFMRRLHAQGTTVVLTTHYLEEAQEMCSRIAILDQGEVKALEPTRTLLQRHPFRFLTLSFSGAPLPEGLRPFVHAEADGSIELKLDRRTQPVAAVLEQLRVEGCVVNDIHTREPDLEDIFVELTKK
ncbi:MAG: ABC transporter ATP-binding protein [Pseudomonadota bacterium]|jgi:ABC-2 type transport system ATP-binding protein|nr:ABC transporter ATP-binding protein [Gammaproteobacteria bacterium]MEC8849795.1 ABC transporter ATP-binding protein [Pseudomonadota bacterium]